MASQASSDDTTADGEPPASAIGNVRSPTSSSATAGGEPPASYLVTAELIANCQAKTDAAIEKLNIAPPPRSHLRPIAEDFLEMARAYRHDSDFFLNKGDGALALEAVAYAHGWLDAGARLGLFEVGEDDQLFTLAE